MPDTVNPQITDAVTQSNVKVLAEAPAMALGTLYQSLAQASGLLYQNAVAQQQQQAIAAQAATVQGVMQIYSVDTATTPAAASASPASVAARMQAAAQEVQAQSAASAQSINAQVEAAVRLANEATVGHSADVAYAARACADALGAALRTIEHASHVQNIQLLQLAATAVCLEAMLRDPKQASAYQAVLGTIKAIG